MKSLYRIFQVYNMNDTVSVSIWNGYNKKRTHIWAALTFTDNMIYMYNDYYLWDFEFPRRCDKIIFTKRIYNEITFKN